MNTDFTLVQDLFRGHYFLFAFLASLGTLQIAVSNAGTRGLWLTPHAEITRWFGIVLILTGIAIFFLQPLWIEGPWAAGSVEADSLTRIWGTASWDELAGARNVNDIHGGLDGTKQAIWFPLAAILAFIVSALVGAINVRVLTSSQRSAVDRSGDAGARRASEDGLVGLANRSFFANLPSSVRNFRSDIGELWRNGLHGADRWALINMLFGRGGSSN